MKLLKIFGLSGMFALLVSAGFAQVPGPLVDFGGLCALIEQFGNVFRMLRTLAFAGAAFVVAGWAWTYITGGWKADDGKGGGGLSDVKGKSLGMLIGFGLLASVGLLLTLLPGAAGCNLVW